MGLASSSSQTQKSVFFSPQKGCSEVLFLDKKNIPSETVDFCLQHAIHILKAMHLWLKMKFLGAILVHPVRSQNFAGKMHLRFYNIWDCVGPDFFGYRYTVAPPRHHKLWILFKDLEELNDTKGNNLSGLFISE